MNVKISIELTEAQMAFAERKVREGTYGSVAEVVSMGLQEMILSDENNAHVLQAVDSMADLIRQRLELPDDQWLAMDEADTLFDDLNKRLLEKYGSAT